MMIDRWTATAMARLPAAILGWPNARSGRAARAARSRRSNTPPGWPRAGPRTPRALCLAERATPTTATRIALSAPVMCGAARAPTPAIPASSAGRGTRASIEGAHRLPASTRAPASRIASRVRRATGTSNACPASVTQRHHVHLPAMRPARRDLVLLHASRAPRAALTTPSFRGLGVQRRRVSCPYSIR